MIIFMNPATQGKSQKKIEDSALKVKLNFIEERLQAIKGANTFRSIDATHCA